jgi:hypothetical protein
MNAFRPMAGRVEMRKRHSPLMRLVFIEASVGRDHKFPRLVPVGSSVSASDDDIAFGLKVRYSNGVGY